MKAELVKQLSAITEEEKRILAGKFEIDSSLYTQGGDFVIDSQMLLKKGKLIEIRPHTRFVHFPKHRHNYIEMTYMCQGSTTHIVNGKKIVLNAGDLLFMNTRVEQEILPATKHDIALNFIVLPEFFNNAFMMLESEKSPLNDFLMSCLFKNETGHDYLYFNVAEVLPIQNLLENLAWTILHNAPNQRNIKQKTMALLFLQLINHVDKIETANSDYKDRITISVLKYIDENYQDASLTQLAKDLNYDFHWLSKEIKKQTGKTFKELLREKKLAQASYLLKHTKLPIEEIILKIGYENTSYFYRIFKEEFAVSPKKYRTEVAS